MVNSADRKQGERLIKVWVKQARKPPKEHKIKSNTPHIQSTASNHEPEITDDQLAGVAKIIMDLNYIDSVIIIDAHTPPYNQRLNISRGEVNKLCRYVQSKVFMNCI